MTLENEFSISKPVKTRERHGLKVTRVTLGSKGIRSTVVFSLDRYEDGSLAAEIDNELGGKSRADLGNLELLKKLIKVLERA